MKQINILNAAKTLDKIFAGPPIKPFRTSYELYKLRRKLQEHLDWQIARQDEINANLDAKGLVGEDKKEEREQAYTADLMEIVLSDVEADWEVVQIPADAEISTSPTDFVTLEGFVDIV